MSDHPITNQILQAILRELPRDLQFSGSPIFAIEDLASDMEGNSALLRINGVAFAIAISHACDVEVDASRGDLLGAQGEMRFSMGPNVLGAIEE